MFDWLKKILGDSYTEEIDGKVAEEIGKGFVARADFNNTKTELAAMKKAVQERDTQLESLGKASGDVETLKQQIASLQAENKAKDETHAKAMADLQIKAAAERTLTAAGATDVQLAMGLLSKFISEAKLDEKGNVTGLDDAVKQLTGNKALSSLFPGKQAANISGASPVGGSTDTPDADPKAGEYNNKLAEARKNGDTVAAIRIKQEAAAEGVILN